MNLLDLMYGDKLRELRGNEKQSWIALKLHVSQGQVSELENGKQNFDAKIITKICAHFKIPVQEFTRPVLTTSLSRLLKEFQEMGLLHNTSNNNWGELMKMLTNKRLLEIEKRNLELEMKVNHYEKANLRIGRRVDSAIYVKL